MTMALKWMCTWHLCSKQRHSFTDTVFRCADSLLVDSENTPRPATSPMLKGLQSHDDKSVLQNRALDVYSLHRKIHKDKIFPFTVDTHGQSQDDIWSEFFVVRSDLCSKMFYPSTVLHSSRIATSLLICTTRLSLVALLADISHFLHFKGFLKAAEPTDPQMSYMWEWGEVS